MNSFPKPDTSSQLFSTCFILAVPIFVETFLSAPLLERTAMMSFGLTYGLVLFHRSFSAKLVSLSIFASGLAKDMLTAQPMGYTALGYLLAFVLSLGMLEYFGDSKSLAWLMIVVTFGSLALSVWEFIIRYLFYDAQLMNMSFLIVGQSLLFNLAACLVLVVFLKPRRNKPRLTVTQHL